MEAPSLDLTRIKQDLDEANRLLALKKFESASDLLASALESLRNRYGDDAPELAPILHSYGRALLEHIIATSGALGGGPVPNAESAESISLPKNKDSCFEFREDVAEEDSDSVSNPAALGKRKANATEEQSEPQQPDDPGQGESENEEEQEEDDDMGVAFTVLDLSRVIFEKILHGSVTQSSEGLSKGKHPAKPKLKLITGEIWCETELQMELAEVRNDLGDIGLETGAYMHRLTKENFEQASVDYEASLNLLAPLIPPYARRLSDAHLRLGLALEFHPEQNRRKLAKDHINRAADVLQHRLDQISHINEHREGPPEKHVSDADGLWQLDEDQIRREEKDVQEMLQDLRVKLDELATNPTTVLKDDGKPVNPQLEQAIKEAFLGAAMSATAVPDTTSAPAKPNQPVNDLSARVKRKKH